MADNIVSKVYRVLTNVDNNIWDKISFWTLAKDVYMSDGTTNVEQKITDVDSDVDELDTKISSSLPDGLKFVLNDDGTKIKGYKLGGADTVIPFSNNGDLGDLVLWNSENDSSNYNSDGQLVACNVKLEYAPNLILVSMSGGENSLSSLGYNRTYKIVSKGSNSVEILNRTSGNDGHSRIISYNGDTVSIGAAKKGNTSMEHSGQLIQILNGDSLVNLGKVNNSMVKGNTWTKDLSQYRYVVIDFASTTGLVNNCMLLKVGGAFNTIAGGYSTGDGGGIVAYYKGFVANNSGIKCVLGNNANYCNPSTVYGIK